MKSGLTPKQLLLALVAVGSTGFGAYQVVQALSLRPTPSPVVATNNPITEVQTVSETEFPTVSTDPFQPTETPIVIQQAGAEAMVSGPGTTSIVSAPVTRPQVATPLRGSIGALPSASPSDSVPEMQEVAKTRATLEFKGVIEAGESLAYISINGERARPFRLGTPISPTVTLTGISHSFVTLQVLDKEVRVRTGQEVELK